MIRPQTSQANVGGSPFVKHPKVGTFLNVSVSTLTQGTPPKGTQARVTLQGTPPKGTPPKGSPQQCQVSPQGTPPKPNEQPSMTSLSIPRIIATVNGEAWFHRYEQMQTIVTPKALRQQLVSNSQNISTDLSGQGVYENAAEQQDGKNTNYDIVNAWQVNFVRGKCALSGRLLALSGNCYNDDAMFGSFHASRPGSKVLDVGCNTGKNMTRALQHGGSGTEVFGIEFSSDSVAVAQEVHGKDHAFQGDASADFVNEHGWKQKFDLLQCTAVLQHMTPNQVQAALKNMSMCLRPGGELLMTFKDAPTKEQMAKMGMGYWAEEVFTADVADKESYLRDGFLRAVMWDDDYYPGVTSDSPPQDRNLSLPGIHLREFVFYSLEWMRLEAMKCNLIAEHIEVLPDSKIPLSALHWMVVFRRATDAQCNESSNKV